MLLEEKTISGYIGATYGNERDPGCTGRIMITCKMFRQLGGYDESMPRPSGCQDTDLVLRMKEQGQVCIVWGAQYVGFSLPNHESDDWKQNVKEKIRNVSPADLAAGKTWGAMDTQNRVYMKKQLAAGVYVRNEGRQIGIQFEEVTLTSTRLNVELQPLAGLTAGEASLAPALPPSFYVTVWGVVKLAWVHEYKGIASVEQVSQLANFRGTPPRVDDRLTSQALRDIGQSAPDVIVDARIFSDKDPCVEKHIGAHARFLHLLAFDKRRFEAWVKSVRDGIRAARFAGRPLHLSVYCRAGEKRSVGAAILLTHCLKAEGWEQVRDTQYLCKQFWSRRTCSGKRCSWCYVGGPNSLCADAAQVRQASLDKALEVWRRS
jgi:hypothetical protein